MDNEASTCKHHSTYT